MVMAKIKVTIPVQVREFQICSQESYVIVERYVIFIILEVDNLINKKRVKMN